jgi:hypothetical protein
MSWGISLLVVLQCYKAGQSIGCPVFIGPEPRTPKLQPLVALVALV